MCRVGKHASGGCWLSAFFAADNECQTTYPSLRRIRYQGSSGHGWRDWLAPRVFASEMDFSLALSLQVGLNALASFRCSSASGRLRLDAVAEAPISTAAAEHGDLRYEQGHIGENRKAFWSRESE